MSFISPEIWSNLGGTGKSMNQLGDEWAIRAYAIPLEENPFTNEDLTDPRGRRGSVEKANIDQPDPIFFLGGSFVPSPEGTFSPVRTIVIPEGTILVSPTVNGILPDAPPIEPSIPNTPEKEQEVRERVNGFFQTPSIEPNTGEVSGVDLVSVDSTVTVDGGAPFIFSESTINNGFRRESSPGGFSYTLSENNIQDTFGLGDVPAQDIPLAVADGYWFAFDTESLSPDEDHTVNFTVDYADEAFELDVTYNILNPIIGTNRRDELSGTEGNDYIVGKRSKDILTGAGGNDLILGGLGRDTIDGGFGSDELWGDFGKDTFIFEEGYGKDTIFDFKRREVVEISGFDSFSTSDVELPSGVSAAKIDFNGSDILTFVNVASSDLSVNLDDGTITLIQQESSTSINFDENTLAAGTIITNQFDGVEFSSSSEFGLMLFDSNNVTGSDFDLAATDLDNILIISEDGDSNDPDDNAAGGTITIEFDELVEVNNIGLLDIDESGSSLAFYDNDSHLIETREIEDLGDNSFQLLNVDVADVARLEINLAGSGAVTSIDYTRGQVSPYSNLYVFGDSLSDPGNIFKVTTFVQQSPELLALDIPVTPPSPPYFEGRFSNGPVWVEQLAEDLNLTLTPSTELSVLSPETNILSSVTIVDDNPVVSPFFNGSTTNQSVNFAFGGAQTGASGSDEFGSLIPGVQQQVEWFVNDHLQAWSTADPDALYILWAGRNDYNELNVNPEPTIDNLEAEIESLYELGARNFLIPNLPDLGQIPVSLNPDSPITPETLTELSNAHNFLLDTTIDELRDSLTGADLDVLDINSLFDDVLTNPEDYGLTNTTDSYLELTTLMPATDASPDEYLFFDGLHPTEVGHEIINDFALSTLGIESDVVI